MKIKQVIIIFVVFIISSNILLSESLWARRIKGLELTFTAAVIERNVSEWENCGLPVSVISNIDGEELKQPITIVKKTTTKTTFYRHLACKLLGEYFLSQGVYKTEHIPALRNRGLKTYFPNIRENCWKIISLNNPSNFSVSLQNMMPKKNALTICLY